MKKNEVYHGDCLEIIKGIEDDSVDMIVTDPPYGINYKSNMQGHDRRKAVKTGIRNTVRDEYFSIIEGDNEFNISWLEDAYRVLKDNSAVYVFIHWKTWNKLYTAMIDVRFRVKNMIVLNKSNSGMGDLKGSYAPKHELILFATKGRHILNFKKRENDVWNVPVKFSGSKRLHPNEKPLSWIEPMILNSSNKNNVILDPFAGSGTTAIACLNTNRNYILIEKEKKYYDICIDRIEKHTHKNNKLIRMDI